MTARTEERRIVVGVDGSQPSRHALQWAQFIAHVLNASIDAVTVWDISAVMAAEWVDDWEPERTWLPSCTRRWPGSLAPSRRCRYAKPSATAAPPTN